MNSTFFVLLYHSSRGGHQQKQEQQSLSVNDIERRNMQRPTSYAWVYGTALVIWAGSRAAYGRAGRLRLLWNFLKQKQTNRRI